MTDIIISQPMEKEVHIFDFFDVIEMLTTQEKREGINKVKSGLYDEYTGLRNRGLIEKLSTDEKTQLKNLKNQIDPAIEIAMEKGYFPIRMNEELIPGLEYADKQGIITIIYASNTKQIAEDVIRKMGISELIRGIVSPYELDTAEQGDPVKHPRNFEEIQARLGQGKSGGIIDVNGRATAFMDDKIAYAQASSKANVGILGVHYNQKATGVSENNEGGIEAKVLVVPTISAFYQQRGVLGPGEYPAFKF